MNTITYVNTPGIYYAISYWMAAMVVIYLNPVKRTMKTLVFTGFIFLVIISCFMIITDGINRLLFIPCMLVIIALLFFLLYFCCEFSFITSGYFCVRVFILGEFMASLGWQLYYFYVEKIKQPDNLFLRIIFFIIINVIIFFILMLFEKNRKNDIRLLKVTKRSLITVIFIGLTIFIFSNLSYVYENTPFSTHFTYDIFIIRTLVDFVGVAILFAYEQLLSEFQMKTEIDMMENMLTMQHNNYKVSQASIEMVNRKYHDLKHQIALLRTDISSDMQLSYLDQIENDIRCYETQNKTGNKILDTILTGKSIVCQNDNISFTCVADGTLLQFMNPLDICTIFGNALDNAIECVRKIDNPDKRMIHILLVNDKSFVKIRIENYFEKVLKYQNNIPVTTKSNKLNHGFGIKSIQSSVNKYGGSVTIHAENNWFELRILLPIDNK